MSNYRCIARVSVKTFQLNVLSKFSFVNLYIQNQDSKGISNVISTKLICLRFKYTLISIKSIWTEDVIILFTLHI